MTGSGLHAPSQSAARPAARIDGVDVSAYTIPTATDEESDGTLVWDSTTIVVVEISCGKHTGLGYSYCHPSAAQVIESKLASLLKDADPLMPQHAWAQMQMQTRQLGQVGIAAMAISAVDIALWDLKARLLGVCLADLLPRFRERVPIYGSGGFLQLHRRAAGRAGAGVGRSGVLKRQAQGRP
jgi:L-alanine-DL-glutamate epimerase-like enolase superfamily enzyme